MSGNSLDTQTEQLLDVISRQLGALGGQNTIANTVATVSGSIAVGKTAIGLLTSSDFSGTILGAAFPASSTMNISADLGKTLPAIAYTIAAGSITIITGV